MMAHVRPFVTPILGIPLHKLFLKRFLSYWISPLRKYFLEYLIIYTFTLKDLCLMRIFLQPLKTIKDYLYKNNNSSNFKINGGNIFTIIKHLLWVLGMIFLFGIPRVGVKYIKMFFMHEKHLRCVSLLIKTWIKIIWVNRKVTGNQGF